MLDAWKEVKRLLRESVSGKEFVGTNLATLGAQFLKEISWSNRSEDSCVSSTERGFKWGIKSRGQGSIASQVHSK